MKEIIQSAATGKWFVFEKGKPAQRFNTEDEALQYVNPVETPREWEFEPKVEAEYFPPVLDID